MFSAGCWWQFATAVATSQEPFLLLGPDKATWPRDDSERSDHLSHFDGPAALIPRPLRIIQPVFDDYVPERVATRLPQLLYAPVQRPSKKLYIHCQPWSDIRLAYS